MTLSDEEFSKLSSEQQEAYLAKEMGRLVSELEKKQTALYDLEKLKARLEKEFVEDQAAFQKFYNEVYKRVLNDPEAGKVPGKGVE